MLSENEIILIGSLIKEQAIKQALIYVPSYKVIEAFDKIVVEIFLDDSLMIRKFYTRDNILTEILNIFL